MKSLFKLEQRKSKKTPICLNDKVDEFVNWNFEIMKKYYSDSNYFKYRLQRQMRDFIEKMAVWYELRYPDYEIDRLMPYSDFVFDDIAINDVMFYNNNYISRQLNEDSEARVLNWAEFYNAKAFIDSLPCGERSLFLEPEYSQSIYLEPNGRGAHLWLLPNGIVINSRGFGAYTHFKIKDEDLKEMHIEDVVQLLKENEISLPSGNDLEANINYVKKMIYRKEEMLNCVMYRIIERGGNRVGPRRALLFAKEFERNIDIPMMYGVDYSDPGLKNFINEYIKAGGSKDLMCYVEYFNRKSKKEKLDTVSIQELIRSVHNDSVTKYTPEETEFHQGPVNALASQIDQDELKSEKVKQLRITGK